MPEPRLVNDLPRRPAHKKHSRVDVKLNKLGDCLQGVHGAEHRRRLHEDRGGIIGYLWDNESVGFLRPELQRCVVGADLLGGKEGGE
jgi:hypothetical protein